MPRPGRPVASTLKPQHKLTHTDSEWVDLRPEMERLYVHERRRLKYVMQYMESEHGFMAS